MRAGCGQVPATSSSDARRAADLTLVEPQARYGADGWGARAARFLARGGVAAAPSRRGVAGSLVRAVHPAGAISLRYLLLPSVSAPGLAARPLPVPGSRRPPSSSAVFGLPVSGARRQVLCGPAQLRRQTDARLVSWPPSATVPPSRDGCPPAGSLLTIQSPSAEGHLWWRPGGSCPGPLGDPVAARPGRGARYLGDPRRCWGGKGPGAGRMLPARGLKTGPNFGRVVEGEVVGLGF